MNVQTIQQNGKPEWAILPYQEYLKLVEKAEMLEDIEDYEKAKAEIEKNGTEYLPMELAFTLIDGANPIKTWREYRNLTQNDLAEKTGISIPYLSQLEAGKRRGSIQVISALAKAMNLTVDDLLPRQSS